MCLGFYMAPIHQAADAAEKSVQSKGNGHDGFSCKGVQIGLFFDVEAEDKAKKHVQTCMIPIEADNGGIAAVIIPRETVSSIVPSKRDLVCCAGLLEAIACPQLHVPPVFTDPNEPTYRSLSAPSCEPAAATAIQIDVTCVENADGSLVVIPRISDAIGRKDPQEMIRSGEFEAYKNAAWDAFQKALNEAGVHIPAFFECEEDKDSDGNWVVSPISIITFMDLLFPCLIKDCDAAFLFNPVENGVAKKKGLFPITLEFYEKPTSVWLPSLIHNDPEHDGLTHKQESSYFVYTNGSFNLAIADHLDPSASPPLCVRMCAMSEFLPNGESPNQEEEEQAASYRSLSSAPINHGNDGDDGDGAQVDYFRWQAACRVFQHKRLEQLQQAADTAKLYDDEGVYLRLANLIGEDVPKHAMMGTLDYSGWVPMQTSDHTAKTRERMEAEKEKERASKRQADAEQDAADVKKQKQ